MMLAAEKNTGVEESHTSQCPPHHWMLGPSVNGIAKGECSKCGTSRNHGKPILNRIPDRRRKGSLSPEGVE